MTGALAMAQMAVKSDWNVRDHVPLKDFKIQAHRGAGDLAEENTLEAFQLGWKMGCIPESDLRTTKDGIIVAFHDGNFSRVVKNVTPDMKSKGVKDVTFAELEKLDVGSYHGEKFAGRHVSKMSDVFALMTGKPDRQLYLDIKNVSLPELAKLVVDAKVESQVILASTKYDIIRSWKKLVPQSQTLQWMGGTEEYLEGRFAELRKTDFADVTQLQIHVNIKGAVGTKVEQKFIDAVKRDSVDPFKESDTFLLTKAAEVRGHGILIQTLPWGATSKAVYWKLMDLGFMSFATDHPDVTQDAVKAYYAEKQ